ncbi:MAG TPA: ABC transporter permease [Blastocatellia bacterium]|nr:ABC transporter permease [Blastocatellia bacterium]
METLWQDLRYGIRTLARRPGFTAIAVLTLALGIGANSALFSVVNAVLLRPFPFGDPEHLVIVWETKLQRNLPFMFASPPNYADWREQNQVFEEMAAFFPGSFFLTQDGEPAQVPGARVTASLFPLLQVQLLLGRTFSPEEDRPGGPKAVVLSHGLWQRRFGADPNLVGTTILLNDQPHTVAGIMPPDFNFPPPIALEGTAPAERADLWLPFALDMKAGQRGAHYMTVIARLKPGVSVEQANAEMNAIADRLEQDYPDTNAGWDITIVPFAAQVLGKVQPALLVLLGAVGCVLAIACANIANMLLSRAAGRRKEFAIRMALGAGRARLLRQLLTESLALALLGGAAGLLLAYWGMRFLILAAPGNVPRLEESSINLTVAGFTLAIALLTGTLFGLAPALQSFSPDLSRWLKEGGRTSGEGAGTFRAALVAAEVALALALLAGAGLLLQSFRHLRGVDAGFQAANVTTLRLSLPQARYPQPAHRVAAYMEIERRMNALPEVEAAGFTFDLPLESDWQGTSFTIEGEPPLPPDANRQINFTFVTPGYFRAMGVPLLRGRNFTEQDGPGAPNVILINETLARRFFPTEDPIGKRLFVGFSSNVPREVVGIVGDVRHSDFYQPPTAHVYVPCYQAAFMNSMSLVARSRAQSSAVIAAAREQIRSFDRALPIYDIKTMEQVVSESLAQPRFSGLLLGLFAVLALALGSVGIYGVISYSVAQRTHEIGVRMALGAQRRDILKMVVGRGMRPVFIGLGIGLAGALWLTRFLSSLLFGVSATDPMIFAGVALLLLLAALLACYVPARRATKVDPMMALRYE